MFSNLFLTILTFGFYFYTYTAYSKQKKQINVENLMEVLQVKKGMNHTQVEVNKVLGLVAATLLPLGYLLDPSLYNTAFFISATHAGLSLVLYYNTKTIPDYQKVIKIVQNQFKSENSVDVYKTISLLAGAFSNTLLFLTWAGMPSLGMFLVINLSLVHFYFMEIDYKKQLQVRPSAYAPFALGVLILIYVMTGN